MTPLTVAIFGGTFDPPHQGHLLNIAAILRAEVADEIWIIPSGVRSDKSPQLDGVARADLVRAMIYAAFPDDARIKIDTIEIDRASSAAPGRPSSSLAPYASIAESTETSPLDGSMALVDALRKRHPHCRFRFVIGAELIPTLPTWKQAGRLRAEVEFLVLPRLGMATELPAERYGFNLTAVPAPEGFGMSVSSTQVRNLLARGAPVQGLVPDSVRSLIAARGYYRCTSPATSRSAITHYWGKYLRLMERGGWEFVDRVTGRAVVALVPLTAQRELLVIRQFRIPLQREVIELPAGLAGDEDSAESLESAAARELLEETGYRANSLAYLTHGPSSAGMATEILHFFLATQLERAHGGGGVGDERITTHALPLHNPLPWLREREAEGALVDPKIFLALFFAMREA